jgi:hypothetical protein
MSARYETFEEPLCLSSLMMLQKSVDKLARSLEEKIPHGLSLRPSKTWSGTTMTSPTTTRTPSTTSIPTWPSAKISSLPEVGFPDSDESWENLKDYGLLCAAFVTIWMSLTLLALTWVRMNDLGYRTRSVSSRLLSLNMLRNFLVLIWGLSDCILEFFRTEMEILVCKCSYNFFVPAFGDTVVATLLLPVHHLRRSPPLLSSVLLSPQKTPIGCRTNSSQPSSWVV